MVLSKEDSNKEQKELEEKPTKVNLPGVEDIPGKKKIFRGIDPEVSDSTIASSDEEGEDVFEDNIDQEIMEQESELSPEEKKDLFKSANDMPGDDEGLREAALDNTDEEGEPLNEESFDRDVSADDLDVPGTSQDDRDEDIGEEDEENNEYSLGDEGGEGEGENE